MKLRSTTHDREPRQDEAGEKKKRHEKGGVGNLKTRERKVTKTEDTRKDAREDKIHEKGKAAKIDDMRRDMGSRRL